MRIFVVRGKTRARARATNAECTHVFFAFVVRIR
jgi:hypothetical protein